NRQNIVVQPVMIEVMTQAKCVLASTGIATAVVLALVALLALSPGSAMAKAIFAVGSPLGELLVRTIPSSWMYELAPGGGANANSTVFGAATLFSWFLLCLVVSYLLISRRHSK